MQVLCGLMKHPQYISETDKYFLTTDDFPSRFEKYIFTAIYNLYKGGAQNITVFDVSNYFNTHEVAKATFESNNGIEYLRLAESRRITNAKGKKVTSKKILNDIL